MSRQSSHTSVRGITPRSQKRGVDSLLARLNAEMKHLGYQAFENNRVNELVEGLEEAGAMGVKRLLQRLLERVADRQSYMDIYMQGRVGLVLCINGFSNVQIEFRSSGPDIRAEYNRQTVYFEVTRVRPNEEDDRWEQSEVTWVGPASEDMIIGKIQSKLSQLITGAVNVVVLWSSTVRVSDMEVRWAYEYIEQEIESDPSRYRNLSGVLFTDGGFYPATLQQFHLFNNEMALRPIGRRLADKLNSMGELSLKQRQHRKRELEDAIRRLREVK